MTLPECPSGFVVAPAEKDRPAPSDQVEWLTGIAARLQQADGYIEASYVTPLELDSALPDWRLVAYIGDKWENAGDGWRRVELTGNDPISKRDDVAVEALWRAAIDDSRKAHLELKGASQ